MIWIQSDTVKVSELLCAKRVYFLGHVISEEGVSTGPKITDCIRNWSVPMCVKEEIFPWGFQLLSVIYFSVL